MAVVLGNVVVTDGSDTTATLTTANLPAHSNGDLLVLFVCITVKDGSGDPTPDITTPAGWQKPISIESGGNSSIRLVCLTKIGDGVESTADISAILHSMSSVCLAFSGANQTLDASGTVVSDSTTNITAPSVTTTVADTHIIYGYNQDDNLSSAVLVDDDVGFNGTLRGFSSIGGGGDTNGFCLGVSSEAQAGIGASNSCVFNMNDTDAACAMTVAIAPSGAGEGSSVSNTSARSGYYRGGANILSRRS